ncbi:MAG: hypothetical protein F6K25_07225 [Okeania sp. SIO2G4]|uniref:hypothetical protein n=1 Tax=unclassified Okeania TaxID=2634635 RepID=UPI0013B97A84|nr:MULTISPECIES: hypothetical protein [unclassified Okeania]NEP41985.1 hypothetical protein [Okeania sp. SIO2H7]NEP72241.1 hypothetical protein [Okeania sp. SIO2G5]NEP92241.1 hypothetical protein [Okeania sp. SIO2F5]NEQ90520.1 hypothetical protein [Okeania sp. SIO2G4]
MPIIVGFIYWTIVRIGNTVKQGDRLRLQRPIKNGVGWVEERNPTHTSNTKSSIDIPVIPDPVETFDGRSLQVFHGLLMGGCV